MDSFEFNKIAGAVLGTALVVFGLKELSGEIYHSETPEKPGFAIEVAEAATGGEATGGGEVAAVSLGTLLASADAAKGAGGGQGLCGLPRFSPRAGRTRSDPICGTWSSATIAAHAGFAYSDALKAQCGREMDL